VSGEKEKVKRQKEKAKGQPSVFLTFAFLLFPFAFGPLTTQQTIARRFCKSKQKEKKSSCTGPLWKDNEA
jgi:hypothetical protein